MGNPHYPNPCESNERSAVGGAVAGVVGALIALPVVAMLKVVVFELLVPERIQEIRRDPREEKQSRRRQLP
jgi:predicted PurR-regulated permease PerM